MWNLKRKKNAKKTKKTKKTPAMGFGDVSIFRLPLRSKGNFAELSCVSSSKNASRGVFSTFVSVLTGGSFLTGVGMSFNSAATASSVDFFLRL